MSPIGVLELLKIFGKGLTIKMAPGIAKGALVGVLKQKEVDVKIATKWVEDNIRLWDVIEPRYQESLRRLVQRVGNAEWLTLDWAIDSMRYDLPSLASLFIGWKKANNWLGRQVEIIRKEIT